MKKQISLLLTLIFASPFVSAASRQLNCTIGSNQGQASIEILKVEDHPELTVFKINLEFPVSNPTGTPAKKAILGGLLVGGLSAENLAVSGDVFNGDKAEVILNPETIRIQGSLEATGVSYLNLYDSNRILQHGFGVELECK